MIGHLRKKFPTTVTSETVKKLALASNNESYVINALQFIGVIDEKGNRTDRGHEVLLLGDDQFSKGFEALLKEAYHDLFDLRGEAAWTMSKTDLTTYFRTTDKTSDVIGGRQAGVFLMFRELAGYKSTNEGIPASTSPKSKTAQSRNPSARTVQAKKSVSKGKVGMTTTTATTSQPIGNGSDGRRDMALTVRIEINLPASGTQETYDAIFKSIRENLLNE